MRQICSVNANNKNAGNPQWEEAVSESEYKLRLAQDLIGRGKVSRRDFIHLGLAAGLTVAAANTLFVSVARA
ncbi:MAG: twin-arginine translocation signal domain-containing protein, partial [Mesorhizobium sp.]